MNFLGVKELRNVSSVLLQISSLLPAATNRITIDVLAFGMAFVISSLVEYWVHRLMHKPYKLGEKHRDHHRRNAGQGVIWEFRDYFLGGVIAMVLKPGAVAGHPGATAPGMGSASGFGSLGASNQPGVIKVLNGAAAGREVQLSKVVTTVGKPGVQVASITKRPGGYVLAHVEGTMRPTVNGNPLMGETVSLKSGDVIELAGTQMQFIQN